jgi:hypothetical protein
MDDFLDLILKGFLFMVLLGLFAVVVGLPIFGIAEYRAKCYSDLRMISALRAEVCSGPPANDVAAASLASRSAEMVATVSRRQGSRRAWFVGRWVIPAEFDTVTVPIVRAIPATKQQIEFGGMPITIRLETSGK